jgi:lysozyme
VPAGNQRRGSGLVAWGRAIAGNHPRKTLAGVVGIPAAAILLSLIPAEESGRVVTTKVENGQVVTTNVRGNQHRTAYRDIVGVVTICDGDTANVRMGLTVTEAECRRRLEDQIINHAEPVLTCIPTLRGRPYQLVPAVSLGYNVGVSAMCHSTAARLFNAGQWRAGCDAMKRFNRAGGRVIRGLDLRRRREWQVCVTGILPGYTADNLQTRIGGVH